MTDIWDWEYNVFDLKYPRDDIKYDINKLELRFSLFIGLIIDKHKKAKKAAGNVASL
jgi:hypothetical protein